MDDPESHPAGEASGSQVRFCGRRGPLGRLLFKNTLLTVLTLGIYRFWAKTSERRYFWNNIEVADDPLEYTGSPGELFIGFLIVLAILFPLGLAQAALDTMMAQAPAWAGGVYQVALTLVFFLLFSVAFYRMWRYRMSRTRWRGIRFGLNGETLEYTRRAAGWLLVTVLSLGVIYPWMRMALTRYRYDHTRLGDTRFAFAGAGRDLVGPWLWVIGPVLVLALPLVGLAIAAGSLDLPVAGSRWSASMDDTLGPYGPLAAIVPLGLVLATPFLYLRYRVVEFRYVVSKLSFGEARFESSARMGPVLRAVAVTGASFAGLFLLLLALVAVLFIVSAVAQTQDGRSDFAPGDMRHIGETIGFFITVGVLFAVALLAPVIVGLAFRFPVVRHFCETLSVHNPEALERAVQSVDRGPSYGEGLADAFDVGGF